MENNKELLKNLIRQRDDIDNQIADASLILATNKVDMQQPLVDSEGFPRSDVDVHAVRTARHKIICLQNDRKALMKEIEAKMFALHSDQTGESEQLRRLNINPPVQPEMENVGPVVVPTTDLKPFVKVGPVTPESPAATSGFHEGDRILQFGSVVESNYRGLQQLSDIVADSLNKPVTILVLRATETLKILVTPRKWSGPGTLGCRLLPL